MFHSRLPVFLTSLLVATFPSVLAGQSAEPWFGIMLPPGLTVDQAAVIIGDRQPVPALRPDGPGYASELNGETMVDDLRTIVSFSERSRADREVGTGMLWGRITGLPSGEGTVRWATEQLRSAGIEDVELQPFQQDAGSSFWLPHRWEVRLLADPRFGDGSREVILESAMPISDGDVDLSAPLVFVGTASPAELAHVDVSGKIAVQKVIPQGHTVFTRDPAGPRAEALLDRGAVAVLNIIDLPSNVRTNDMGCGGGPCLNLGGQDGLFLESVLNEAAEIDSEVLLSITVQGQAYSGLSASNGVAVISGSVGERAIVVNAHADAWFQGAGDNADGLAVMLALARHFARSDARFANDLVFVVSAGHHSRGLSGPAHFLEMNPDIAERAALIINLEHTSQRHITPARSAHPDGYREWVTDSFEAPIVAGVSNESPAMERAVAEGIQRYGTNFVSGANPMASGEGGSFVRAGIPVFTTMQGPPLYHTTGEGTEMISVPGMERIARFMAFFLGEMDREIAE